MFFNINYLQNIKKLLIFDTKYKIWDGRYDELSETEIID